MIAARMLMNATAQATFLELCFGRGRAIRAVRVHVRRRVGLVQKSIEFAAVMHARVGHLVVTDQLVLGIHIHVVLVAVEALTVLLGPACILDLSAGFSRGSSAIPLVSCRPSRPHSLCGYYVAWEPARSWHQPSGRHGQCSPALPNAR